MVRLPVAHCDSNPIEMAWKQLKDYVIRGTFKKCLQFPHVQNPDTKHFMLKFAYVPCIRTVVFRLKIHAIKAELRYLYSTDLL